jgi:ubiquinone/menaquinone biosynthesis C-methylase UbiE
LNGKGGIGGIEELVMTDINENINDFCNKKYSNNTKHMKTHHLVVDDEGDLPFDDHTFDLIITSLNMHWINDLPKRYNMNYFLV